MKKLFIIFMILISELGQTYQWQEPWSIEIRKVVQANKTVFDSAKDINAFCPRYQKMLDWRRLEVWVNLFKAIAFYESSWNPSARMIEPSMGIDPVTKLPVHSEGLLQMSYQDTQWAKFCAFDWAKDKDLAVDDPSRTILNPIINLDCGLGVMRNQIQKQGLIVLNKGAYWAVIKQNNKNQKLKEISAMVQQTKGCK